MDNSKLWSQILKEMQQRVSQTNFAMWLKNTSIAHQNDDTLAVAVDNAFTKSWVEDKYLKDILGITRTFNPSIKKIQVLIKQDDKTEEGSFKKTVKRTKSQSESAVPLELKVNPETGLNVRYTIDSFVVGPANELAHAAASAIIDELGTKYNPFFVYGGVGLGKTHLIQSIGNELKKRKPGFKTRYVTSEKFTNDVIWSIRKGRTDDLKKKYRDVDLLIIDDIQFIGGKEKTEEEFFHTFNALHQQDKQIIISSDRAPHAIPTLEERLRSRFEGGLIADISNYDFETRVAIIKSKLEERGSSLNDDVVHLVAHKMRKSVRELEGILTKLIFWQERRGQEITKELAGDIVDKTVKAMTRPISDDQVIEAVIETYNIKMEDLLSRSRRKEVVIPRQVSMYLLRDVLDLSYPHIGEKLGRDHTTAIHSYEKICRQVDQDAMLNQQILRIRERLTKG